MDDIAESTFNFLNQLLPGFLAAWVFYGFTTYPQPSQFERVIQALIFTLFISPIVFLIKSVLMAAGAVWPIGAWNEQVALMWSTVVALLVGVLVSHATNNDYLFRFARNLGVTRKTSFASVWFGAFSRGNSYVVLHLEGGRRLYGWPTEWPDDPTSGHFLIQRASWLLDDGSQLELTSLEAILVDVKEVVRVEFVPRV